MDTPQTTDQLDALAKRMVQIINTHFAYKNLRQYDTKTLLGAFLEVMVADAKNKLELLHGANALAKACVEEKRETASPRVPLSDVEVPVIDGKCELYYVVGHPGRFYPTKMAAEIAARAAFPDEDGDKRYARVFYRTFNDLAFEDRT